MAAICPPAIIGVNLKMYMDRPATIAWAEACTLLLADHPAVVAEAIEVFVLPSFPLIDTVAAIFAGTKLATGAQNVSHADGGAYTGEVSPVVLRELGCQFVAVGHFERRHLFHEGADVISRKMTAAFRNELTPILCVGESNGNDLSQADSEVLGQLRSALELSAEFVDRELVIAYEPTWAIGATAPAPEDHVHRMCRSIRRELQSMGLTRTKVIYGGSAGPGLFDQLSDSVDGLFLGRLAHDARALVSVVDEVWANSRFHDFPAVTNREEVPAWPSA